jgi:hypothetical protein
MILYTCDQGSEEWFALKAGRPTASNFDMLVTSKGEPSKSMPGYAITLAAEMYAGKPVDSWAGNQYTDRGKLLEPDARAFYSFLHDYPVEQVGFITDDRGLYGCSPDGLVNADGMTEIKCLKAENHIKAVLYYRKNKVCPPDYVQQTQGQMFVANRKWCDLVFYHPDLPSIVIRQERNDEFIKKLEEQIHLVIQERDKILAQLTEV